MHDAFLAAYRKWERVSGTTCLARSFEGWGQPIAFAFPSEGSDRARLALAERLGLEAE